MQKDTAEIIFRKMYRDKWIDILSSPMGKSLLAAIYSQRPSAIPDNLEHKNHHRLGQIMNHDLLMYFISTKLTEPISTNIEEIPQNYPEDTDSTPEQKEE